MADDINQIILDVQSVCPDADPNLARLWVRDAGRRTMEARQWSWLHKRGQFVIPATVTNVSSAQTVTTVQASDEITFSGAVATESMVGRQFRTSTTSPIYDIIGYVSTTKLKIAPVWGEAGVSGAGFTIFQNRLLLPSDCQELLSVISPLYTRQLWLNVPQETIDSNDPTRSRSGGAPSVLSPCDYSAVFAGGFASTVLSIGTGPKPIASGTYSGQDDATYTVQVTTGGVGGTAVFQWKKDEGTFTTLVTSDASVGNSLSDGLTLLWPDTSTFILNAVFTVRAKAQQGAGAQRVEIYPYSSSAIVLPFWYVARYPDLTDDGVQLPGILYHRSDVLREKALEFAASWPGTQDGPNAYNQINRRDYHAANWLLLAAELARQDNALMQRNVLPSQRMPYMPWPFPGAGNLQNYDPPWAYPDFDYIY